MFFLRKRNKSYEMSKLDVMMMAMMLMSRKRKRREKLEIKWKIYVAHMWQRRIKEIFSFVVRLSGKTNYNLHSCYAPSNIKLVRFSILMQFLSCHKLKYNSLNLMNDWRCVLDICLLIGKMFYKFSGMFDNMKFS